MLQSNGAFTSPRGGDMPWVGRKTRQRNVYVPLDADQYSLGSSSVVRLRSHSVMIQSFRSRVTW